MHSLVLHELLYYIERMKIYDIQYLHVGHQSKIQDRTVKRRTHDGIGQNRARQEKTKRREKCRREQDRSEHPCA